jgi:predicted permease
MPRVLDELRHTSRLFRRNPGLALAAIAALAMGIGFTTTMFSIVHGGTRSLPFDEPHEIVALTETLPGPGALEVGARPYELLRWQRTLGSVEGLGAFQTTDVNLSGSGDRPERVGAAFVTPETFGLVGVAAAQGRLFGAADASPDAPRVALISHTLWQSRFAGAPDVVGRDLRLDGRPVRIVGVMPPRFGFPINAKVWLPLAIDPSAPPGAGEPVQAFARLRDGVGPDRATDELVLEMRRLASEFPAAFDGRGARVFPFTDLETPPEIRRALQLLVAIVSLVLLVACANVANLLLARAAARSRDTAIRTALGASRARLVAQQLAESVLLASVAALLGLGMASVGLRFFAAASSDVLQAFWVDFRIDTVVVAFATGLGFVAAIGAGLVPALRASSTGTSALLQSQSSRVAGPRIGRLGRGLVVVQLALACGFLIVTATFVGAAGALRLVPNPFPAAEILTAQISVLPDTLSDPVARRTFVSALHDHLAATPELRDPALVSAFPGRGTGQWSFEIADDPTGAGPLRYTALAMVTPPFFDLASARAVRGRLLTWQDDERAPRTAVVNESFARRFLADREDPLGRRLQLGQSEFTVVGVVPDLLMQDVEDADGAGVYVSMLQQRPYTVRVMARTTGPAMSAAGALRRAVAEVDPDLPVLEIASLHDAIYADKRVLDAIAALFLCFGLGAVFMAVIGLHAVLSFAVTQRTPEFGVRLALGATSRDIVRLVLRRGALELAWGLGLGLTIALVLSRLLAAALEQVQPAGPGTFVIILVAVTAGALAALWRPLRRAVRLDPLAALRHD